MNIQLNIYFWCLVTGVVGYLFISGVVVLTVVIFGTVNI